MCVMTICKSNSIYLIIQQKILCFQFHEKMFKENTSVTGNTTRKNSFFSI